MIFSKMTFVKVNTEEHEFLQEKYTKNRTFDWYDIVANALGAITSFFIVKFYNAIQNKNISH